MKFHAINSQVHQEVVSSQSNNKEYTIAINQLVESQNNINIQKLD